MMQFLTTLSYLLTMAVGVALGGFVVFRFNPDDLTINGKNKVKNGGEIDYKLNTENNGFFKRNFRRRKRMGRDS